MTDHEQLMATVRIVIAWVGLFVGGVTLSNTALTLTIVFTVLQIYKLVRDLWFPPRPRR